METLTKTEIKCRRDEVAAGIAKLEVTKIRDLDTETITVGEFRAINGQQLTLELALNELNVQLLRVCFAEITVGDDSPAAKIGIATSRLNETIEKLDEIREFLGAIADVIDAINQIIGVIAQIVGASASFKL